MDSEIANEKYELCKLCQHFIEDNDAHVPSKDTYAVYIHLEDGETEFEHDATPSGNIRTGEEWERSCPHLFPYPHEDAETFLARRKAEGHHLYPMTFHLESNP